MTLDFLVNWKEIQKLYKGLGKLFPWGNNTMGHAMFDFFTRRFDTRGRERA